MDRNGNLRERLELWSAALLAAATLTTAYSAYEATRWGGQQSTRFTQAGAARTESAKAQSRGFSFVTIDADLFTQFAVAYSQGNKQLERDPRPALLPRRVQARLQRLAEDAAAEEPRGAGRRRSR